MKRSKQRGLPFGNSWGGARAGAGRKPKGRRAGVSHRTRERLAARFPVHVTCKLREGLPRLRNKCAYVVLKHCFGKGRDRFGFRLNHYSVQGNHLHLIVEARDERALSRGMQGLSIRIAKRLNRLWDRCGSVFADRYHGHILRTPREVRSALAYVLNNCRKHGLSPKGPDPYSSAGWFDGWKDVERTVVDRSRGGPCVVVAPRSWLLGVGWRRHGLVRSTEVPG